MTKRNTFYLFLFFLLTGCTKAIIIAPNAVLPDGSVYQGDMLNGKFHGNGTLKYADDSYYKGEFVNGLFHGQGELEDAIGTRYVGEFNHGKQTGAFVVTSSRYGYTYTGEMLNDVFHGRGEYQEGEIFFVGDFKDGRYHGQGKITYGDTSSYEGEFVDGAFTGHGKYVTNGNEYVGDFKEGRYHGKGKLTYSNNAYYEGDFVNGEFSGQGKYVIDQSVYEGDFDAGNYNGMGKITYSESSYYEGQFVDGTFSGHGKFVADDRVYEGAFEAGQYNGKGKETYSDSSYYEGYFEDGVYSGQGKYVSSDTVYEGSYVNGALEGEGSFVDYEGNKYLGEVSEWVANGTGELTDREGNIYKGIFDYGYLSGEGERIGADGSYYKGGFNYNQFDGQGKLINPDKSTYEGEFSYGQFYGEGVLTTYPEAGKEPEITKGTWESGSLVYNAITGVHRYEQSEIALQNHQVLLETQLSKIEASSPQQSNAYFIGVAGDGKQSVFRREVEFVSQVIDEKYNTKGRSMLLVNHHDSASEYALATGSSITSAINHISEKMDHENDVLFLYMTSHGSKDYDFYLGHDSIGLPNLPAKELAEIFDNTDVKWKVIFVSACYSGGFIDYLQNDTTLVVTAADEKSQSFGCSEDSEMTYFGRALFKEVLANNNDVSIPEAFSQAKNYIERWEAEQDIDASNPMISAPTSIIQKLSQLNADLKKLES